MQKHRTPKTPEIASAAPVDAWDRLVDCESKLIALKSMTEALSDLLAGPFDKEFSPTARRRLNAAFQVAWSVEDMAEEAKELVQDERLATRRGEALQGQTDVVAEMFARFRCGHDDMVGFVDDLLPIVDLLKIMQVALEGAKPYDIYGPQVFASNIGTVITGVERLLESMNTCFNHPDGRPGRRHDRAAEAGAA